MTLDIALVLGIVLVSLVCFVTGLLRMDIVALLVLVTLAVLGLVSPADAIKGFSNPAVVTIAGMFVISAALARTGVASLLGRQIHRFAGSSPQKLLFVMMMVAGVLSAFMNSVGLAAMMLPVVADLGRRTRTPPSKLLMPLVLGALLGGTTSLVGTAGNIVASDALRARGYAPFQVFDFTPIGAIILVTGVLFVSLVGWRLLPNRNPHGDRGNTDRDFAQAFDLRERIFSVRIPNQSLLHGRPLAASRLGSALGLHVLAIVRGDERILAPNPGTVLHSLDKLLVEGRPELLKELQSNRHLRPHEDARIREKFSSLDTGLAEVTLSANSSLVGRTPADANLRSTLKVAVLALKHDGESRLTKLQEAPLAGGDLLLMQGRSDALAGIAVNPDFENFRPVTVDEALASYPLADRLVTLKVTAGSMLVGHTLGEARLADAAGLTVLVIQREGDTLVFPDAADVFQENDTLLVTANPEDLRVLRALQRLELLDDAPLDVTQLESDRVGLLEVVLAPRTSLVGQTPRQLQFREKYGLSLLAIWREGRPLRSNLRDAPLKFGDSLLLFGPRARLRALASEPDFIGLSQAVQVEPNTKRAPIALAVLLLALIPALAGWMPIYVSVLAGATLAVVARCLTIEEAYRGVELSAIVLIAAMLPLGAALENSGAATLLVDGMLGVVGDWGPRGVLAGLCVMTAIGSQAIPATALVVLMSPIAITAAQNTGVSPHALIMGVALSASSLSSPVGHPANALIMGPGGYRYVDYVKVGLPLTIMLLLIVIFVMPLFFPLT